MVGITHKQHMPKPGFTLVELLIVIVVIAILAAITTLVYNGIANNAKVASLKADLAQAAIKIGNYRVDNSSWPSTIDVAGVSSSPNDTFAYSVNTTTDTYCLSNSNGAQTYFVTNSNNIPTQGACSAIIADGSPIQTVTSANCPTSEIRAVDARDSHTYWVQKLADGKCWMLTNLAYAGGGTNTYGDTKSIANGGGSGYSNTTAYYYIPTGSNPTTEPTPPSTSTTGTGQYGYLYNFCAANGVQTGNGACSGSDSTAVDTTVSICPAGWRLPTNSSNEFATLNTAINGGLTSTDNGLRSTWLAQYSGYWYSGFGAQGSQSYYWSSTQSGTGSAYGLYFYSTSVNTSANSNKFTGYAVRCIAN